MIQIDKRGSIGERFYLLALTSLYPRRVEYRDGDYNGILFLGIAPNDIYMYCIKIENIDFDNQKIDHNGVHVNLHNRGRDGLEVRATGAGYKCDLKPEQMRKISTLSDLQDEFEKEFGDAL